MNVKFPTKRKLATITFITLITNVNVNTYRIDRSKIYSRRLNRGVLGPVYRRMVSHSHLRWNGILVFAGRENNSIEDARVSPSRFFQRRMLNHRVHSSSSALEESAVFAELAVDDGVITTGTIFPVERGGLHGGSLKGCT